MAERPKPPLWKFWPVLVLGGFVAYEFYEAHAGGRPIDWLLVGLCSAGILGVVIVRGFMRV